MSLAYVFTAYGGPDTQRLIERSTPQPEEGQLVVDVRAAGVNPADWKMRVGMFGQNHTLPRPMGLEVSGLVIGVGEGVAGFSVGDAVLGPPIAGAGGFVEHTLLGVEAAVAKPDKVSFAAAATLPVAGTTAYDLTHQLELETGQRVLIVGAGGGVGTIATQICQAKDLEVIGVAGASKRELVESLGARFVLSGDGFAQRVREFLPEGADLVIDLVGGDVLRQAVPLAIDPSRVVSPADPSVSDLGGDTRQRDPDALRALTEFVVQGSVEPHIAARFPLEQAGDALALVESGYAIGKVVIEMAR